MAKAEEKKKARIMRREGNSINNIARILGVSKGSVSLWCRDIELSEKQKDILRESMIRGTYRGRMKGAEMNRRRKEQRINVYKERAKKEVGTLSQRDMVVLITGLYWGEGAKSDNRFIFSNSDPVMVKMLVRGLQEVWKVNEEDFICRVLINGIHKSREKDVLRFWRNLLELPSKQFRSTTFIKTRPKKKYNNHDRYYGTLKVSVRKSSHLQSHLMGLIYAMKEQSSV